MANKLTNKTMDSFKQHDHFARSKSLKINFMKNYLQTKISSPQISCDGYEVDNLLLNSNKGYLAESFIKPPVLLNIEFVINVYIDEIIIHTKLGMQKSRGIELFVNERSIANCYLNTDCDFVHFKRSQSNDNSAHRNQSGNTDCGDFSNCRTNAKENSTQVCLFKMGAFKFLNNTKRLSIKIYKTEHSGSVAIRSIQVIGSPNYKSNKKEDLGMFFNMIKTFENKTRVGNNLPTFENAKNKANSNESLISDDSQEEEKIKEIECALKGLNYGIGFLENTEVTKIIGKYQKDELDDNHIGCKKKNGKRKSENEHAEAIHEWALNLQNFENSNKISPKTNSSHTIDIPEDFLDPITHEFMTNPLILPSGKIIDKLTLDKYVENEIKWCRLPNDPFTNLKFTSQSKPVYATHLKSRMDKFLIMNDQYENVRNLPRTFRNNCGGKREETGGNLLFRIFDERCKNVNRKNLEIFTDIVLPNAEATQKLEKDKRKVLKDVFFGVKSDAENGTKMDKRDTFVNNTHTSREAECLHNRKESVEMFDFKNYNLNKNCNQIEKNHNNVNACLKNNKETNVESRSKRAHHEHGKELAQSLDMQNRMGNDVDELRENIDRRETKSLRLDIKSMNVHQEENEIKDNTITSIVFQNKEIGKERKERSQIRPNKNEDQYCKKEILQNRKRPFDEEINGKHNDIDSRNSLETMNALGNSNTEINKFVVVNRTDELVIKRRKMDKKCDLNFENEIKLSSHLTDASSSHEFTSKDFSKTSVKNNPLVLSVNEKVGFEIFNDALKLNRVSKEACLPTSLQTLKSFKGNDSNRTPVNRDMRRSVHETENRSLPQHISKERIRKHLKSKVNETHCLKLTKGKNDNNLVFTDETHLSKEKTPSNLGRTDLTRYSQNDLNENLTESESKNNVILMKETNKSLEEKSNKSEILDLNEQIQNSLKCLPSYISYSSAIVEQTAETSEECDKEIKNDLENIDHRCNDYIEECVILENLQEKRFKDKDKNQKASLYDRNKECSPTRSTPYEIDKTVMENNVKAVESEPNSTQMYIKNNAVANLRNRNSREKDSRNENYKLKVGINAAYVDTHLSHVHSHLNDKKVINLCYGTSRSSRGKGMLDEKYKQIEKDDGKISDYHKRDDIIRIRDEVNVKLCSNCESNIFLYKIIDCKHFMCRKCLLKNVYLCKFCNRVFNSKGVIRIF